MGMEDLLKRSVGTTISIDVRLEDGLLTAMIDSNQVELALLNLVVNARDVALRRHNLGSPTHEGQLPSHQRHRSRNSR
jgi:signal transduction histidine kinase